MLPATFTLDQTGVRVIEKSGEPWFILCDLLTAMGTKTKRQEAVYIIRQELGSNHVDMTTTVDKYGRKNQAFIISEASVALLLTRSPKISKEIKTSMLSKLSDLRQLIQALCTFEVPNDLPELFIYIIREKDSGNIKIGISRNPEARLKQLQTGNSQPLELVSFRSAENRFVDERALHNDAEDFHLRGEWFSDSALEVII